MCDTTPRDPKEALDVLGQQHVMTPEALGEEAAFLNFVLPLLVGLHGQRLRPDLLAVPLAVVVEVADPPYAGTQRALEDAARSRASPG